MYGENLGPAVVPVVAGASTVAVMPTTGASTVTSIATAVAVGLVTWGVVYYYRAIRGYQA